jgi:hypothetical protein
MNGYERMLAEQREEIERLRGALSECHHEIRKLRIQLERRRLSAPPDDPDPTGTER